VRFFAFLYPQVDGLKLEVALILEKLLKEKRTLSQIPMDGIR